MKNRILEINNDKCLYVLERTNYNDKNYILGALCNLDNNRLDVANLLVREVLDEGSSIRIKSINDEDLAYDITNILINKFREVI